MRWKLVLLVLGNSLSFLLEIKKHFHWFFLSFPPRPSRRWFLNEKTFFFFSSLRRCAIYHLHACVFFRSFVYRLLIYEWNEEKKSLRILWMKWILTHFPRLMCEWIKYYFECLLFRLNISRRYQPSSIYERVKFLIANFSLPFQVKQNISLGAPSQQQSAMYTAQLPSTKRKSVELKRNETRRHSSARSFPSRFRENFAIYLYTCWNVIAIWSKTERLAK